MPELAATQAAVEALIAQEAQSAQATALLLLEQQGFGPGLAVTNEFTHAVYAQDVAGFDVQNFANAGARALGTQEPFGPGTGYDSNLGAQLVRFQAAKPAPVAADTAAVLFIGSNDFGDILGDAAAAPNANFFSLIAAAATGIQALISELETSARLLSDSGVGTVFFGTLPAATFFPATAVLDALSNGV